MRIYIHNNMRNIYNKSYLTAGGTNTKQRKL